MESEANSHRSIPSIVTSESGRIKERHGRCSRTSLFLPLPEQRGYAPQSRRVKARINPRIEQRRARFRQYRLEKRDGLCLDISQSLRSFPPLEVAVTQANNLPNVLFFLDDNHGCSDTTLYGTTRFYDKPGNG